VGVECRPRGERSPHGVALRAELGHVGLDVEDGGAVEGVQALYVQAEGVGLDEAAAGDAEPVGAGLPARRAEGSGSGARMRLVAASQALRLLPAGVVN
jgi:hypothetical protein